ncbi:MAG: NADH-quinone oxidoreductase subunit C [Campylobacterota bacterium]|nr:NADH-quinone oxidoreductase subunit C [Campylobacterota bacterium]
MIENIKIKYDVIEKNQRVFKINIENNELLNCIDFLTSNGFITLVQISCTDWIEDEIFSLNYNLTTQIRDINLLLQIDINRDDEKVNTLQNIFPQACVMERDLHEMYGIEFVGNDTLGDFALEDWSDIPPLRREFDTLDFVNEHYNFKGGRDDNKDVKAETKRRKAEAKKLKELEELKNSKVQEQEELNDGN